jgi:hypothetical protein
VSIRWNPVSAVHKVVRQIVILELWKKIQQKARDKNFSDIYEETEYLKPLKKPQQFIAILFTNFVRKKTDSSNPLRTTGVRWSSPTQSFPTPSSTSRRRRIPKTGAVAA